MASTKLPFDSKPFEEVTKAYQDQAIPDKTLSIWFGGKLPDLFAKNILDHKKRNPAVAVHLITDGRETGLQAEGLDINIEALPDNYINALLVKEIVAKGDATGEKKYYAWASDVARLSSLFHEGGRYFDSDLPLKTYVGQTDPEPYDPNDIGQKKTKSGILLTVGGGSGDKIQMDMMAAVPNHICFLLFSAAARYYSEVLIRNEESSWWNTKDRLLTQDSLVFTSGHSIAIFQHSSWFKSLFIDNSSVVHAAYQQSYDRLQQNSWQSENTDATEDEAAREAFSEFLTELNKTIGGGTAKPQEDASDEVKEAWGNQCLAFMAEKAFDYFPEQRAELSKFFSLPLAAPVVEQEKRVEKASDLLVLEESEEEPEVNPILDGIQDLTKFIVKYYNKNASVKLNFNDAYYLEVFLSSATKPEYRDKIKFEIFSDRSIAAYVEKDGAKRRYVDFSLSDYDMFNPVHVECIIDDAIHRELNRRHAQRLKEDAKGCNWTSTSYVKEATLEQKVTHAMKPNRFLSVLQDTLGWIRQNKTTENCPARFKQAWNKQRACKGDSEKEIIEKVMAQHARLVQKACFFTRSNVDFKAANMDLKALIKHATSGGTFGFGNNRTFQALQVLGYLDKAGNPLNCKAFNAEWAAKDARLTDKQVEQILGGSLEVQLTPEEQERLDNVTAVSMR